MNGETFLRRLERAGLLTGAWHGIPYDDLPDECQDAIRELIWEIEAGEKRDATL